MSQQRPRSDSRPGRTAITALCTLSQLLSELHGPAAAQPLASFRHHVLEQLSQAFAFDSAVWASGAMTAQGPDFHTITLWHQPPELLRDYEQLKHLDPLFAESARNPGHSVRATARTSLPPAFIPFVERYGLEQAMSTMHTDPRSLLLTGISVWRRSPDESFEVADADMMEAAFPHLMQVASRRVLAELDAGPTGGLPMPSRAAVDGRGRLHCADAGFGDCLAMEFPQWIGPDLPDPLRAAVQTGVDRQVVLDRVAASVEPHGDLVLVRLRPRMAIDDLTPRQREIVELSAQGLNHKEIARRVDLSPSTVRNHIAHAYERLGVRNRAELTNLLLQQGHG
jgi:DNA-binding CsgD family transcriptional regulator